jgi:hypothetical protein
MGAAPGDRLSIANRGLPGRETKLGPHRCVGGAGFDLLRLRSSAESIGCLAIAF